MKTILVIPDLQVPYHDERSLNAVEQMMANHKFDEVIQIGDFMDFDCISAHNKDKLREVEGKRLQYDYDEGNKILDRWQKLHKGKITILEGNHEYRIERYLDACPQMEGYIEVPTGLNLKKRKITWVPFWSKGTVYTIGKATFIHGKKTNNFHSKAMAYAYGRNVFYGHTHDIQSYSVETEGDNNTYVGQSLGCLCQYKQKYMRGSPSKWQQCFAVFHFFDDGYFNYEIIRVFKHRFFYAGKTYEGR